MRKFFGKIKSSFLTLLSKLKSLSTACLGKLTYTISRLSTGTMLTLGSLVGVYSFKGEMKTHRLAMAGMTFIVGLPIGVIMFGQLFNLYIWMTICVLCLFLINLHNAWETIVSLKNGALDYHMMRSTIESVESITPDIDDFKDMQKEYTVIYERIKQNSLRKGVFSGSGRLIPQLE